MIVDRVDRVDGLFGGHPQAPRLTPLRLRVAPVVGLGMSVLRWRFGILLRWGLRSRGRL